MSYVVGPCKTCQILQLMGKLAPTGNPNIRVEDMYTWYQRAGADYCATAMGIRGDDALMPCDEPSVLWECIFL